MQAQTGEKIRAKRESAFAVFKSFVNNNLTKFKGQTIERFSNNSLKEKLEVFILGKSYDF